MNVIEPTVVQPGCGGHDEAPLAPGHQDAQHQGGQTHRRLIVESQIHLRATVVVPQGPQGRQAVEGQTLQAADAACFQGNRAVESQAQTADKKAFPAVGGAHPSNIHHADLVGAPLLGEIPLQAVRIIVGRPDRNHREVDVGDVSAE